jgi:CubicO group peptidase (beta-lactamase class C family)
MRTSLLIAFAFATALSGPVLAAPLDTAAVDTLALKTLADSKVPAASIAIVQDGRIVYAKAYGQQGPGTPAVTQARYPIASISKQITATAILMLADEGKLSLSDPVGKYVPGLTDGDTVTIAQVLSHTAGYRDYWPQDYPFAEMARPVTPQEILDRWAKAPLDFPPGTQWQYSNTGFVIAGQIVEKVSGEPLMTFLGKRVFTPLGMASAVDIDRGMTKADAVPHMRYALGPVRVEQAPAPGWLFAAGELAMTASDLARWDIGMIQRKLLTPASYAAQQTSVKLADGKDSHYGLGITIRDIGGHRILEHGGEAVGFLSENIVAPDDNVAVVVLDNADFGDAQTTIARGILAMLLPDAKPGAHKPAEGTARARAILDGLREGRIDRSRFTDHGNAYFTETAIGDYKASLGPLGAPTAFKQVETSLRGGFTEEVYEVSYASRKLQLIVRAEPGENGKIEQFTAYPAS